MKDVELWQELMKIPGGYTYSGACSYQICFPLTAGGELRFMETDDGPPGIHIDFYDGALPPGITGWAGPTGEKK